MRKPTKIPLISDPEKYYYLPWEVDKYIKHTEEKLQEFENLITQLEFKDVILWDGEQWVLSHGCE